MMNEQSKLPPGREPLTSDWFAEQLGTAQQKVMSLTVAKKILERRLEKVEERSEVLEELIMDVVADCRDGAKGYEIEQRIAKVMQGLDGDG
jgi:hypothetical protein